VRDGDGFDEFYRETRQRVLQYVYVRSAGDLADAQDAVAEAYARAWQRWAAVSTHPDPEAWVRMVAWRILANGWRKLRGRWSAYRRHGPAGTEPPVSEVQRRARPELRATAVCQPVAADRTPSWTSPRRRVMRVARFRLLARCGGRIGIPAPTADVSRCAPIG
jgi:DNA-directed RNA polymerase specialized sigma24 family protein